MADPDKNSVHSISEVLLGALEKLNKALGAFGTGRHHVETARVVCAEFRAEDSSRRAFRLLRDESAAEYTTEVATLQSHAAGGSSNSIMDDELRDILDGFEALNRMLERFITSYESTPLAGELLFAVVKAKDAADHAKLLIRKRGTADFSPRGTGPHH